VYGLASNTMAQRSREIGLRLALGAPPARVAGLVLRDSGRAVGLGALLGAAATLAGGRIRGSSCGTSDIIAGDRRSARRRPLSDLVLTLIGPDRPGLVEAVAQRVAAHGGNWLESRMAQFAGILRVELPPASVAGLQEALRELESEGLRVVALSGAEPAGSDVSDIEIEIVGQDHPGIVRDIALVLVRHGANIEELVTDRRSAPMAGSLLFTARARVRLPASLDAGRLRKDLETIAHDLMVDLKLVDR
jgi:glycine cleavage system regulatory protein